ncbi:hypothetical protein MVEG_10368 [Podila verticillata NRRL 6337]|nr:hypothetical protein MVEG_10368 [Podila verticillata NRRL 6337]
MKTLNGLKRFLRKLGGYIDLSWNATRKYVEQFCMDIAETSTVVLEIDYITSNIHHRDYVLCMTNFFAYTLLQKPNLKLVTLLNFPQTNEKCLYTGNYELQLSSSSTTPIYDWVQLRSDLIEFGDTVSKATKPIVATERKNAAHKLQSALAKHGLQSVPSITSSHERWNGVFCLQEGAFVEIHSSDKRFPPAAASTRPLRKLTVDFTDVESVEEIIAHIWRNSSNPLRLTFLDRTLDSHGHVIAQAVVSGQYIQSTGSEICKIHNVINGPPSVHGPAEDSLGDHKFLQWECDSFFSPPSDYLTLFLDEATRQHPLVLTMFTLDISSLSRIGFGYVRNVFHRSKLECLDIICCVFHPDLSDVVSQVHPQVRSSHR